MKRQGRSAPGQAIILPRWLTPAFARACLDAGRCKGEAQIARYTAIARGEDWEMVNQGKLEWGQPYTCHFAYDLLAKEMHVGRRVTRTGKGWPLDGTVVAVLPGYRVEVAWDNRARQTCHVTDLKEAKL